jgi:VanZ family protein
MLNLLSWMTGPASARTWRVLLVLLVIVVSYLALTPKPLVGLESGLDKVAHLIAFTALTFSGYLGFPASRGTRTALTLALLAYGGLIEVLQLFVPGRTAEWGDLLADGIGIAVGVGLAAFVIRFGLQQR